MLTDRSSLFLVFGLTIGIAALCYVLDGSDLQSVMNTISGLNLLWVVLLISLYGFHFWMKAARWQLILRPICQVPIQRSWPPMIIGYFANNILPAHLGEFVRMYSGARSFGISSTQVLTSLILERLLDLLSILTVLGILLISGGRLSGSLVEFGYLILILVVAGVLLVTLYALRPGSIKRLLDRLLFFFPGRLKTRLLRHLDLGASGLSALLHPGLMLRILGLSVGHWLIVGVMVDVAFISIGAPSNLPVALMILVATVFAVSLPSSPGFFGSVQLAFVLASAPYGVNRDLALAASIVFHLTMWASVNIAGIIALDRLGMNWTELKKQSRDAQHLRGVTRDLSEES